MRLVLSTTAGRTEFPLWRLLVVGLGTLASGMIGVSNILFVSVRERASEFGLRRALGATAPSILGFACSARPACIARPRLSRRGSARS